MTPFEQLQEVNSEVNAIPYVDMGAGEPPDLYSDEPMPGHGWVCRMYVERKATLLRQRYGWNPDELREILCYVETGERHAVLSAQAPSSEAWVLDSRQDQPYRLSSPPPGYRWEAIQIAGTTEFQVLS